MKLVIGLVLGAVIGALIGYMVWGRQVNDLQARVTQLESKLATAPAPSSTPATTTGTGNPHIAVIEVVGANGEDCKAKVNPDKIGNHRNYKVYWVIDADSAQCAKGVWHVELHFDNDANGTAYNGDQDIPVVPDEKLKKYKIKNTDNIGTFPYKIYYVQTAGPGAPKKYLMADPELQIEM